eukprot:TRINITY_DN30911_c0_g1_i2.p1 TRINITY_DN30911_c0_g1~~TRINITY_DN30911_c0_g1_i2.p1  ORF type:complete len:431 (+),score=51.88 TRINITY_DN30911_c0_g1_i2:136-1428(+)
MVVQYPSAGEAHWSSFFTVTPKVLFFRRGSIFPNVLPQVLLVAAVSILAVKLHEEGKMPVDIEAGNLSVLGFLLSFLIVFKTNASYQQFWTALTAVDGVIQLSNTLGMMVCSDVNWNVAGADGATRTCLRLVGLHYYVLVEKFHRTGKFQHYDRSKAEVYSKFRGEIRKLATRTEMEMLYPGEDPDLLGSESRHGCTNPRIVLFWLKTMLGQLLHEQKALLPPICNGFSMQLNMLIGHCIEMDKIDKTQFPLPYAQIVKLYLFLFVFVMPFVLAPETGWATPFIAGLAALGFYGLDEVAEVLESPFGQDANDIDLTLYGRALLENLELYYNMKETRLDAVIGGDKVLSFAKLLSDEQGQESKRLMDGFRRASTISRDAALCKEIQGMTLATPDADSADNTDVPLPQPCKPTSAFFGEARGLADKLSSGGR